MAPKGGGKGREAAVQNASTLRSGAAKKKGDAVLPSRIANAQVLRSQYAEVQHSPDGADPQPLTVPKCVECSHCGWPVYPRDSRVATKKTFEKAGIQRDYGEKDKKEKKEKKDEHAEDALDIGDEDDEDGDAKSEDSIGTVEMLETKVQEMEERLQELESFNAAFEKENAELKQQCEDLEEALSASEEKIELLEESEDRWREKNSVLRVENDELRQYIHRLDFKVGDLESDMVKKLIEIRWRKEQAARDERRRALMLQKLDLKLRQFEGEGLVGAIFKIWQEDAMGENRRRETQLAEERRRLQVGELGDQLRLEKHHVLSLEHTATRLRGNLKTAAQRMLMKVFSTTQKPWADGHAMTVWIGCHVALKLENELHRTQKALAETQQKLREEEDMTAQLSTDLEQTTTNLKKTTKERDELATNYATLMSELQATLGNRSDHASSVMKMAEEKAQNARDALVQQVWDEANAKMAKMNAEFEVEKTRLEDQVGGLEAQLEALKRGMGGAEGVNEEHLLVVPKGQGVLCCGCLRQILNRGVKQLPPVSMPKAKSPSRKEERQKKSFFSQELQGMPDPDDLLHSEVWKSRRDPMAGLRFADVSPDEFSGSQSSFWPAPTKSASTSRLTPLKTKVSLKFKPAAFR